MEKPEFNKAVQSGLLHTVMKTGGVCQADIPQKVFEEFGSVFTVSASHMNSPLIDIDYYSLCEYLAYLAAEHPHELRNTGHPDDNIITSAMLIGMFRSHGSAAELIRNFAENLPDFDGVDYTVLKYAIAIGDFQAAEYCCRLSLKNCEPDISDIILLSDLGHEELIPLIAKQIDISENFLCRLGSGINSLFCSASRKESYCVKPSKGVVYYIYTFLKHCSPDGDAHRFACDVINEYYCRHGLHISQKDIREMKRLDIRMTELSLIEAYCTESIKGAKDPDVILRSRIDRIKDILGDEIYFNARRRVCFNNSSADPGLLEAFWANISELIGKDRLVMEINQMFDGSFDINRDPDITHHSDLRTDIICSGAVLEKFGRVKFDGTDNVEANIADFAQRHPAVFRRILENRMLTEEQTDRLLSYAAEKRKLGLLKKLSACYTGADTERSDSK